MFVLELWDSPQMLLGELALSVAVIAGILFVARLANARSGMPTGRGAGDPLMPPGEAEPTATTLSLADRPAGVDEAAEHTARDTNGIQPKTE